MSIIDWREALLDKVFRIVKALRMEKVFPPTFSFSTYSFTEYFKGFEKVEAVRRIFGETTEDVIRNLRVDFIPLVGYMGVNSSNGHLIVNPVYLNNGDRLDVYLDVIHELVHIRQRMEGKGLFDSNFSYGKRPTEVEAYRYAVEEARRLRLSNERICEYLKTPWMSEEDFKHLAKALNVNCMQ